MYLLTSNSCELYIQNISWIHPLLSIFVVIIPVQATISHLEVLSKLLYKLVFTISSKIVLKSKSYHALPCLKYLSGFSLDLKEIWLVRRGPPTCTPPGWSNNVPAGLDFMTSQHIQNHPLSTPALLILSSWNPLCPLTLILTWLAPWCHSATPS